MSPPIPYVPGPIDYILFGLAAVLMLVVAAMPLILLVAYNT